MIPEAVGTRPFSAGGQLGGSGRDAQRQCKTDALDVIDKFNCKPKFRILIPTGNGRRHDEQGYAADVDAGGGR